MPPSRRALLLGNAELLPVDFVKRLITQADFILAADGAANALFKNKILPHAVIGDLDSVSPRLKKQFPDIPWIFVNNQNNTDLEKALDWLTAQGFTHVTIAGITGGRVDFTLGNILSLIRYTDKIKLCVQDIGWQLYPVTTSLALSCQPNRRVSLLPYKTCRCVCTRGLKYPLKQQTLSWKKAGLSLSNETIANRFSISLQSGFLWVYVED